MSIKRWKLGWKRCECIKCDHALTVEQTEENCGWVMWEHHKEEVARLKAEVERLRASSFVTAVPVEQYERVIKAGDAMSREICILGPVDDKEKKAINDWNAAKEGKQP